jgi:hypothetical protein
VVDLAAKAVDADEGEADGGEDGGGDEVEVGFGALAAFEPVGGDGEGEDEAEEGRAGGGGEEGARELVGLG